MTDLLYHTDSYLRKFEASVTDAVDDGVVADGGTHVANTSEVGPLQIVDYKSKGRMNKRLVVALAAANNTEGDGDV